MSEWHWLGGRRLNEVVEKSLTHLELVVETVKRLDLLIKSLKEKRIVDAQKYFEEVVSYERRADDVKRDILRRLRGAFIHPLDREDLLRLLLTADDIAAYTKASARRIISIYNIGSRIPDEIIDYMYRIIGKTVEAAEKLLESVKILGIDPGRAVELTHNVEKLEEEIDEIRMKALEKLFSICREKLVIECILIRDAIEDLESISDMCEDTSDVVRVIALSS